MRSTSHARVEQGEGNVAIAACDESTHSTALRSRRGHKEYRRVLSSTAVVFGVLPAGCLTWAERRAPGLPAPTAV
jgi:hypothetical protein